MRGAGSAAAGGPGPSGGRALCLRYQRSPAKAHRTASRGGGARDGAVGSPAGEGSPKSPPLLGISPLGCLTVFLVACKLTDESKLKLCHCERFDMKKFNYNQNPLT